MIEMTRDTVVMVLVGAVLTVSASITGWKLATDPLGFVALLPLSYASGAWFRRWLFDAPGADDD